MRILFLIAAVVLVFLIVRTLVRKPLGHSRPEKRPLPSGNMVRCDYCGLHVPDEEALLSDGRRYCSQEHRELDRLPRRDD
ncbi:PP0621 family protein [Thioalkalivibrio thiocyanodenitrificans]|uniref:PP0621 family protein n=1 Tax=Thioalkalivibrio thiocyanodenitrificans TaxID=243063 RepID=UPI000380F60A|nr:PP0621 family protein [Thioalkalivibrio thiocyanodenitrificans]